MPHIDPYQQGKLASPLVGTPGISTRGNAFRQFAGELGQLRDTEAAANRQAVGAADQAINAQMQTLGTQIQTRAAIGRTMGGVVQDLTGLGTKAIGQYRQNQKTQAAQQTMLNHAAVSSAIYNFQDAADQAQYQHQQQYIDNPEDAPAALDNTLQSNMQSTAPSGWQEDTSINGILDKFQNDPNFKNDPVNLAKLQNGLQEAKKSYVSSTRNWAFHRQTAQAHDMIDNAASKAVDTISQMSGDVASKYGGFKDATINAHNLAINLEPVLGRDYVQKKRMELDHSASLAFFQNLMNDAPDDPEARMGHLDQVKQILSASDNPGTTASGSVLLTADERKRIQGGISTMENQAGTDLSEHLGVAEATNMASIRDFKTTMDSQWDNETTQQNAIGYAQGKMKALQGKVEAVQKSNYPDKVKQSYIKSLNSQATAYDGIINKAHTNLQHIDTMKKQGINAAIAERKAQQRHEEQLARADLKQTKDETQANLNALHLQMTTLDPVEDAAQLKQVAHDYLDLAQKAGDAGYITRPQARANADAAIRIVKNASIYRRSAPNMLQQALPFLPQPKTVTLQGEKKLQAQNDAVKEVMAGIQTIGNNHQQAQVNQAVGMAPNQQAEFDKWSNLIQKTAQTEKWSKDQINQRLTQLRSRVMQSVPATKSPTVPDAPPAGQQYAKPGPYRTTLNAQEEQQFNSWVKANNVPYEDSPTADYDMRGYWKDIASKGKDVREMNANDHRMHFPDTYKTPYHQSFSNESKYAKSDAPHWANDHQLVDKHGNVVFDERAKEKPHTTPKKGLIHPPPTAMTVGNLPRSYWQAQARQIPRDVLEEIMNEGK